MILGTSNRYKQCPKADVAYRKWHQSYKGPGPRHTETSDENSILEEVYKVDEVLA